MEGRGNGKREGARGRRRQMERKRGKKGWREREGGEEGRIKGGREGEGGRKCRERRTRGGEGWMEEGREEGREMGRRE